MSQNEYVPLIRIKFILGSKCIVTLSVIDYLLFLSAFPCEVQAVLELGRVAQFTLFSSSAKKAWRNPKGLPPEKNLLGVTQRLNCPSGGQ